MVKFCMFSTLRLWSLVGSVMGCWEKAGSAVNAISRIRIPTLSQKRGKGGAPSVCREGEERPTQAKAACVVYPVGYPPSPPPPKFLVFIKLRRFSGQNIKRMGVIRKILWNKDLAD